MDIERCSAKACRRPFEISETGGSMPGSKEPEDITCPHCGHTITRRSNGVFNTHALTAEREAEYNVQHPL
jgi:hypothetical protein